MMNVTVIMVTNMIIIINEFKKRIEKVVSDMSIKSHDIMIIWGEG